jgi:hypothetical protein
MLDWGCPTIVPSAWFGIANANTDVVRTAAMAEAMIIDVFLYIIIVDNGLQ